MNDALFLVLDNANPEWVRSEALKMMEYHPSSEKANSSGKFYSIYECWHFHRSSEWPLIRYVIKTMELQTEIIRRVYAKNFHLEFFVLSRVSELGQPVSLWHKDGYFFDGQIHLTITGNANVDCKVGDQEQRLVFPNGQLWYLNGSNYEHRVPPTDSERIELCAPVNQRASDVEQKKMAIVKDGLGWVDGTHSGWTQLRRQQSDYVRKSVALGKASNLNVADFSVES